MKQSSARQQHCVSLHVIAIFPRKEKLTVVKEGINFNELAKCLLHTCQLSIGAATYRATKKTINVLVATIIFFRTKI